MRWFFLALIAGCATPGGDSREGTTTVVGRRVELVVAAEDRALGERLGALADRAVEEFARTLDRPLPDYRFNLVLSLHPVDEKDATALLFERLAHDFMVNEVRLYGDLPLWFAAGVATLLSDLATGGQGPATTQYFARELRFVRAELEQKRFLPIERILEASPPPGEQRNLFEAEIYSILRFLDAPANPERRTRFRLFLKEVANMRGFAAASRVNRRFRNDFGDLSTLEREWLAWQREEPTLPLPE